MFAYCGNSPISRADFGGHAYVQIAYNYSDHSDLLFPTLGGGGGGCGYAVAAATAGAKFIHKVKDFVNNESEAKALQNVEEYGVAFYKDVLVIRTPFDASFSFGLIGMSNQQIDSVTLNHEYGHTIQMENKGLPSYVAEVAVPSVTINILHRKGKLKYDYFGAPWEAEADMLGGVSRISSNTPWPADAYNSYWDVLKMFWE